MLTICQLTASLTADLTDVYPAAEAGAIADLVVEHLLNLSPMQRRLRGGEEAAEAALAPLPALRERLLGHEPVQYVLGKAWFADMELEVTPATLIPRPETEELVQLISREHRGRPGLTLLDVGTGSGCIALALCRALTPRRALALDVSGGALEVARRNAGRYSCPVEFVQADILGDNLPELSHSLDVLVSNPPYVRESERSQMRANVLDYEPATALFVPDADPLLFYRRIAELGRQWLRPGGALYFEINEAYAAAMVGLVEGLGYGQVRARADIFGKDRMLSAIAEG
ncbi:peptide chain release factor N(5)-glutamine methyltransferase [Hymenobacter sp. BT175]|uniref:peptide chain release factor N(5)-glutamine methyltransferase n=1 Tax=Hymenobacter translucens TaxID=2886507 RepID=UPI001D0F466A|nr:peptide chain release factor N(5)-glutamine methyltransferase [Hymenobacter translucens]MCC2545847.1 peptide chain release factor N(5)-glutamine methyltransferase [Hymenobacter translucens]